MWYSPCESARTAERARGTGEKGRRDDDDELAAGNVDSGFLSAGNMQVSGEVRDAGTPRGDDDRTGGNRRAAPAPEATTLTSSPVAREDPTRVTDSGVVDVDLSEGLNQLTLRWQPGAPSPNPLAGGDHPARPEPGTATLLLTSVKAEPKPGHRDDDSPLEHHRRDDAKGCAIMNENTWRLYYAQDHDGDT